ncbi:MAG: bifunctional diguanylate cyclase/phosphodiesterase, partial [Desulfurella sp.]|uniref:bifunctional diguanylate cyclase/phosphodiesterase n=1 Tax=Desulfurella sp. TaxID=1962857 RepID=UPI003D0C93AD
YNTLSKVNHLLIKSTSKNELFEKICDVFVNYGEFDLAGLFILDDKNKLKLTKYSGKNKQDIEYLFFANDKFQNPHESWPTIKSFNKKSIFINNDTLQNKNLTVFKQKMLEYGFQSSCALPIIQNGKTIGVINLYSKKPHIFDKKTYELLKEIVDDINYALDKFENQKWMQMFSVALNSGFDFVVITDFKFDIVYVNETTLLASGYKKEELLGKNHRIFSSELHSKEFAKNFYTTLKNKKIFADIILYRTKNGQIIQSYTTVVPYEFNNEIYYIAIGKDLSKDKGLQFKLDYYINHDPVTSLYNQKYFLENIDIYLKEINEKKLKYALVILDPKDFTNINTYYGFSVGDDVLREIVRKLQNIIKPGDIIARLSENKFGLFVKNLYAKEQILDYIEILKDTLSKPITVSYGNINIEFNIGVSFFPDNAKNAQDLLAKAYVALKHAKEGNYPYKFYQKEDEEQLIKQIQLKKDLEKAVKENEFTLYYQPYVKNALSEICGAECLLRWDHNGKIIAPSVFIETLEATGLIEYVEDFIIDKVAYFQKTILTQYKKTIPISINIAPNSFKSKSIIRKLTNAITKYDLDPKYLSIEILERLFIENFDYIKQILHTIKGLGVSIALDDFGTGYSSLSYLSQLPINTIKIDISFIKTLETNQTSYQLVKAIASISKNLNLKTIAEGVENSNQQKILKDLEIDCLQGYLFYKPMDEENFKQLLNSTIYTI